MYMRIRPYHPDDEPALLELERISPQGRGIVLGMRRKLFSLRAEMFSDHLIMVAEQDGSIIGVGAVAMVPIRVGGRQYNTSFYFDWRVAKKYRRKGISKEIRRVLLEKWRGIHGDTIQLTTFKSANIAVRTALLHNDKVAWIRTFRYLSIPTATALPMVSVCNEHVSHISTSLLSPTPRAEWWQPIEHPHINDPIAVWRTDKAYHLAVERIAPWYAPVLSFANHFGRHKGQIPKIGEDVSFSVVSGINRSTVHYLSYILRSRHTENVTYAVVIADESDEIYQLLHPFAVNDMPYILVSDTDMGSGMVEIDVRCL